MEVAAGRWTRFRLKVIVLTVWLLAIVVIEFHPSTSETYAQTRESVANTLPPDELIDAFDKTLQSRFLSAPNFGIRRIVIPGPAPRLESSHLNQFHPNSEAEHAAVAAFENSGWDVGIYLFGRRVELRTDTKEKDKYDIKYRLFDPIPITKDLKPSKLRESKKMAEEIKQAFVEFQKPGSPNENELRFSGGKWALVARPVRAVNQSCLECHKDYVITERLGDGQFTVRKRRIGDANGILVYAFAKRGE